MALTRTAAKLTRRTLLAALPASFFPTPGLTQAQRPAAWAAPVTLTGLPNLHRVSEGLYRSAQPDATGFVQAEGVGLRSVISLRQTLDDAPLAAGTRLVLHRVPMKSRHVAELRGDKIVQVMRLLQHGMQTGPVLVHCHHGADRTGLICALYRILSQGWSREAAVNELINGGYGFHPIWANIPRYIATVDLADLQARIAA